MAHKTLIDGTEYEIKGGLTLVEGTSYGVKDGKVLVDGTEYSISFILPPAVLDLWKGSGDTGIKCLIYAGGYWVAAGQGTSTNYATIAYATKLNGPWTIKNLWNGSGTSGSAYIVDIAYADGYWVALGHRKSTYSQVYIAYSTSLDGSWTTRDVGSMGTKITHNPYKLAYSNGTWAFVDKYYDGSKYYARIYHATALSGSWTYVNLWGENTSSNNNPLCLTYANGYWAVGGIRYESANYACVYYATELAGSWSHVDIWNGSYYVASVDAIIYADGYWVVGGVRRDSSAGKNYASIAYATTLGGAWTTVDIWDISSGGVLCLAYANGYWVAGGREYINSSYCAKFAYSTSLSGAWTVRDAWPAEYQYGSSQGVNDIIFADGWWLIGGQHCVASSDKRARIAYAETLDELCSS